MPRSANGSVTAVMQTDNESAIDPQTDLEEESLVYPPSPETATRESVHDGNGCDSMKPWDRQVEERERKEMG